MLERDGPFNQHHPHPRWVLLAVTCITFPALIILNLNSFLVAYCFEELYTSLSVYLCMKAGPGSYY